MELLADLQAAARFGGEGTGVTRVAWSPELFEVYRWFTGRIEAAGLTAGIDPAGNVLGRWSAVEGKPVLVGSHLDTVPRGGRYDGALGVLSALEAVRILRAEGVEPRRPVWLAAFMDEEGTRFATGVFGSRAFAGHDLSGLGARRDRDGTTMREAMAAAGFDFDRLPQAKAVGEIGCYLELHIEQGPVLEAAGIDVGIVTGIVGVVGYRVRLSGEANHAGTTPMAGRRDALAGAARAALALRDEARAREGWTANVGQIRVEPGGANVIPGLCELSIDIRAPSPEGVAQIEALVPATLERIAAEEGLGLELEQTQRIAPVPLDPGLQDVLERAAEAEGASHLRLPSGAGHDAMVIGLHVPAAMLFVPSRGGVSHSPAEHTDDAHCELGARVLARALRELVS